MVENMGRRFSDRIHVNIDFYCHDLECFGTILNLSGNGMLISSKNIDFPFESQFKMHIPLQKEEVEIAVKVVRVLKTNGYYDGMGIELINPPDQYVSFVTDLRRSQEFINKLNIIINSN
jgi:hypothetical protein